MDKNAITGLLLMAVVFFGIMWLRPKNEGTPVSQNDLTEQAEQAAESGPMVCDSLGDNELDWLRKNLVANGVLGTLANGRHIYTVDENGVDLTLDGDSIYGTVTVEGKELNWADVESGNTSAMTVAQQREALDKVRNLSLSMGKYGKFSKFLNGTDEKVKLENDVLALELSSKSGSVTRAELKKYFTEYNADETKKEKRPVVLFENGRNEFDFELPLSQPISSAELFFTPVQLNDSTVRMKLELDHGAFWALDYTLPQGESYVVRVNVVQQGMKEIVQSNNSNLVLNWQQDLHRQEKGRMFEERNSAIYYKMTGGSVENLSENKNDTEERKVKLKWIGFKNQFFSTVMVSRQSFSSADFESTIMKNSDYLKHMKTRAVVSDYDWSSATPASFDLFLGPNLYPLLSSLDHQIQTEEDLKLTKMIPLGWNIFRWINTGVVIPVFTSLSKFITNYGIIILVLTIFIKIILFPFTWKSYQSQAKMRVLAPDIKAINDKYPGQENAMTRQQKTMALYSRAGANPMSGCLPMLLQMPILFAMFSFFPNCIELRGEGFLWAHDLSAPDAIISWSGNIPLITEYFGNHISLFCLLMTGTNILYTYINMQNQQQTMPGMKVMMYLMPLMFLVFFNNYASGLSYYYFLSLLITIVQTYCFRFFIKEEKVRKQMAENAKKPKKKSGFMARLEAMQKEQQRMLAEQQKRGAKR